MNIKSKRILAVSTIIALSGLLLNPAQAEDVVTTTAIETTTEVVTTSVPATGIINVQNIVVNDNQGTNTAADFEFTVKHFGTNVDGSPFSITDETGTQFTLEPGTYVVAATALAGYLGSWSGEGIENGFIDLKAGQEVTIVRHSDDIGISNQLYSSTCNSGGFGMGTGTFPCTGLSTGQTGLSTCDSSGNGIGTGNFPCTAPVTEDGGLLPATSTNWFNLLALGFLLSAAGAYSFRKNSVKI